jgi:hypothetical protein
VGTLLGLLPGLVQLTGPVGPAPQPGRVRCPPTDLPGRPARSCGANLPSGVHKPPLSVRSRAPESGRRVRGGRCGSTARCWIGRSTAPLPRPRYAVRTASASPSIRWLVGCCASTSRRAPTYPDGPPRRSTPSPTHSTADLGNSRLEDSRRSPRRISSAPSVAGSRLTPSHPEGHAGARADTLLTSPGRRRPPV